MAAAKTMPTYASVEDYLNSVPDEAKRQDSFALLELMEEVTGEKAVMWGDSIVGFGTYHYVYASGRRGRLAGHRLRAAQTRSDALHHGRLRSVRRTAQ